MLDPACGSGNFLYVALHALKDIERRALVDASRLGLEVPAPRVGLACVRGIEIEEYAAELARVTLWIGDLQWNAKNNYTGLAEPILSSLDQIECRDALLNKDGTEAQWPAVDVIVGNPPFLGGKKILSHLPEKAPVLRSVFEGRVPPKADFVTYWIEKARQKILASEAISAGFVTTNMVRGTSNRQVMEKLLGETEIFEAWSDEAWALDGADVRVSMFAFGAHPASQIRLDGVLVDAIQPDLKSSTYSGGDVTPLTENLGLTARGFEVGGPFDVPGETARKMLKAPANPNGRKNSEVLRPLWSGKDLSGRFRDLWLIDFDEKSEADASMFEAPFALLSKAVHAEGKSRWWRFRRSGSDVRELLARSPRVLATVLVSKHRQFRWLDSLCSPDTRLVIIGREDDTSFGILSSRFHELWTLRFCQRHGVGNDPVYTPSTTFETFPFPEGLTPNIPAADYADDPRAQAIAAAAAELNRLREAWLNPPDLVRIEPEVVPGYPDRVLPASPEAAAELKKRTLTNLYNQRPTWLDNAHKTLDAAVAAAYGWPEGLTDDEVLERLFALNQERAAAGR